MGIPFRPKDTAARELIKDFKEGFDNPDMGMQENTARLAVTFSRDAPVLAWRGELLHQLALRAAMRGETVQAKRYFQRALEASDAALEQARVLRDYGLLMAQSEDIDTGLALIQQALQHHDDDLSNTKGERQRRITESYLWRVQLMQGANDQTASKLIDFALTASDCHLREQQVAIAAALPYATEPYRQQLLLRRVEIFARRRKPLDLARSAAWLALDVNIVLAGKTLRALFRKE